MILNLQNLYSQRKGLSAIFLCLDFRFLVAIDSSWTIWVSERKLALRWYCMVVGLTQAFRNRWAYNETLETAYID